MIRSLRLFLVTGWLRRPMVLIALTYGCGLLLGDWIKPPFFPLLAVTALCAAALSIRRVRPLLFWPTLVLAGWASMVARTSILNPSDLRVTQGDEARLVTVRGILADTPVQKVFVKEGEEAFRSEAHLRVTHLLTGTNWAEAKGLVLAGMPATFDAAWFRGKQVQVTGVLAVPPGPKAPGLFDYRRFLERQGVYFQLRTSSLSDWQLLPGGPARPLGDAFLSWAKRTLKHGLPEEDEALRLLWSMTLGWKTGLPNEAYEPFMASGTIHIFAISGLHVALISGLLLSLLRTMRLPRFWCGALVLPLIWFYTAATGWQPSAERSTIMMSVVIGGWMLSRPSDLLNSLAAAAFIILLWDPQQLFGASFQLSFFVVLSIALLVPHFTRWRDVLIQPDPLLPPDLVRAWRCWAQSAPARWLSTSTATSLAACLGAIPLTACYFHLVSPVTLLANLAVVPLSSCALAASIGSLICGPWLPFASELCNHSAWFFMECMLAISHWAANLPGAYRYVPSPGVLDFFAYYFALLGASSGVFSGQHRRLFMTAGLTLVAAAGFINWESSTAPVRVTAIPHEGGMALHIHNPLTPSEVLVDCGTTNTAKALLKPFLHARGLNRLSALVLTHGDARHVAGAEAVYGLFQPPSVCVSPLRFRSPVYRKVVAAFSETPGLLQEIPSGSQVAGWTVLHPDSDAPSPQADDNALVLFGNFHGRKVLLLSDLGPRGQERLLQRVPGLKADVVVTGLPSAGEPLLDHFLESTKPKLAIVVDSEFPAYARAKQSLHSRFMRAKIPVIFTASEGTTTIECGRRGITVRTMRGTEVKL